MFRAPAETNRVLGVSSRLRFCCCSSVLFWVRVHLHIYAAARLRWQNKTLATYAKSPSTKSARRAYIINLYIRTTYFSLWNCMFIACLTDYKAKCYKQSFLHGHTQSKHTNKWKCMKQRIQKTHTTAWWCSHTLYRITIVAYLWGRPTTLYTPAFADWGPIVHRQRPVLRSMHFNFG